MATKTINVYNDILHGADLLASDIQGYLTDYFHASKSDVLREFDEDEIAKCKTVYKVEVDH